jgi:hypothetical protein
MRCNEQANKLTYILRVACPGSALGQNDLSQVLTQLSQRLTLD